MAKNTRPRDTSANRARKDKNPAFQRFGKSNGSYKGGNSPHAYRLKAGAKPGQIVHHMDHNKKHSVKGNLKPLGTGKTAAQRFKSGLAQHNKKHPEKGIKAVRARMRSMRG
jgi:hypothetical protein